MAATVLKGDRRSCDGNSSAQCSSGAKRISLVGVWEAARKVRRAILLRSDTHYRSVHNLHRTLTGTRTLPPSASSTVIA